jgi:hypothetical protein
LIAQKVMSLCLRSAQPKGDTDRRDLKLLLLALITIFRRLATNDLDFGN